MSYLARFAKKKSEANNSSQKEPQLNEKKNENLKRFLEELNEIHTNTISVLKKYEENDNNNLS